MTRPTIDDLFAVMAAASVGDVTARVELPAEPDLEHGETRLAIALNILLDDLAHRVAETERAHVAEADQQRALLAAIVDSSDDAILGSTLDGTLTSWNLGAQHLYGYTAAEMLGRSILELVPAERHDEARTILRVLAHGAVMHIDTVHRKKTGALVDVSLTTSPIRGADGRVIGISTIGRDITDRLRTAATLARAKDAAETANRELESFSYSVAHDLRSPLRAMNGYAHLLLEEYREQLDEQACAWLDSIQHNARRMAELIDGLLALARVTRSELAVERVDLGALARDAAAHLAAIEPARHVEVVVHDDLIAHADARLARVLIDNLVGNAWKFTCETPAARIEVGALDRPEGRTFFVRDNGVGFDMAFANKLFVPFQRLHAPARFAGTGIGLATVERIVSRHAGIVWAESVVDRGTTIYFTLGLIATPAR